MSSMNPDKDAKFFALLVHQNLLKPELARQALAESDPLGFLLNSGAVTPEQWQEWVDTEAGMRPKLSRYELGSLLGEGGTARVFQVKDLKSGEQMALKVLKPALCKDATAVEKFIREGQLLMQLDNEYIVKGLRVAREGQVFFCALQVISGRCLQDDLDEKNPLAELQALQVVAQVAKALAYLHGRSLVHRDIKPGNIMLQEDGRAVLIDLGFAVKGKSDGAAQAVTSGTAHYISPEQAKGSSDLDVRADIYSLGVTLYHLVTGSLPFSGTSSEEVMAKQVLESLSGQRIRDLGLSPQTHYFIEKMMAKEKEIRYQDPAELIGEIEAHLAAVEREEAARPMDAKAKLRERQRRRREK